MKPYYSDESVTLYHGDSLEILPALDVEASALLTDPPYFKVKKDAWDNQWGGANEFLSWMGDWLDCARPFLKPEASLWVFASPAMSTAVERVIGERFRVLSSIRWVKQGSMAHRMSLPAMRSFVPFWEGIIFAEQQELSAAPMRAYLRDVRDRAGMTSHDLNRRWQEMTGTKGETPKHWFAETQWQLPTPDNYQWLIKTLGVQAKSYDELFDEYQQCRRPFVVENRKLMGDIWDFASTPPRPGRHPCEKPLPLMEHMIRTSTREGDVVLDPFAGSGSTLVAARSLGRRAIGIEQDERWCERAANRLSHGTLEIFGVAA